MGKRGPAQLPRAKRFAARTTPGPPPEHRPELGPCLLWTGTRLSKRGGYGTFYDDDTKLKRAHRVAWELATGDVLTSEQHVLHECDTPACVRPSHLRLGDQRQNMADMNARGRRVHRPSRGANQYLAKLTDELVLEARTRFAAGEEIRDIVQGCASPGALKMAIYGTTWQHVPMPSYADRERPVGQSSPRCRRGHAFTPENTAYSIEKRTGYRSRYCKQCNRDRARANMAKKRAAKD